MRDVCAGDSFFHLCSFARRSFPREMADSRETIQRVAVSGEKVFRNQRSEIKRQQQRGVRQNNRIGEERWENIGLGRRENLTLVVKGDAHGEI